MIKFVDGPAAGQTLMVRRAPLFLRAVISEASEWDALDQLTDLPTPVETCHVYVRVREPGRVHLHGPKIGGWYATGSYRYYEPQPAQAILRRRETWEQWATKEAVKLKEAKST